MGELQIKEFINLVNSMDAEEQKIVVSQIPSSILWDELKERDQKKESIIAGIHGLLN